MELWIDIIKNYTKIIFLYKIQFYLLLLKLKVFWQYFNLTELVYNRKVELTEKKKFPSRLVHCKMEIELQKKKENVSIPSNR